MSPRLALLLCAPLAAAAQTPEEMLRAAREVMEAAPYCFLITVDGAGQPQARLMQQFPPEADLRAVWMGTHPASRKAAQIRANPRAALACSHAAGPGYVTLTGRARLEDDPALRRKYWRPDWDAHFPGGPGGPGYILIEFTPERLELVSGAHKTGVTPASPRPPALVRRGGAWAAARD
jgi:general stress protein 26